MIGIKLRFGRSNAVPVTVVGIVSLLILLTTTNVFAIFGGGMYPTRLKMEYQYSDYTSYRYPEPLVPIYPDTLYQAQDPHIADFPENRSLVKITQTLSPISALQLRYQYSDLTQDKEQHLFYTRYARDVNDLNTVYLSYQHLQQPDNYTGQMYQFGIRQDRSGWIVGETSFSFLHNVYDDGNVIDTYAPMLQMRFSVDAYTAILGRWEGYWTSGDNDDVKSFIYSLYFSRFFPTQTAVHIGCRYYDNDLGVVSYAPAFEIAQYVLWNLTLRASYRYYENEIDNVDIAATLEHSAIRSHSYRAIVEWEAIADVKLHLKLRRYSNNQHIGMNTYLLGFEVIL